MSKFRRGGYVFVTWVGDHGPKHVHVYRNGKLVVKWDIKNNIAVKGNASRKLLRLIAELQSERLL